MTLLESGISFHFPWCSVTQEILLKTNLTIISSNRISDKGYTTRRTAGCLTTLAADYVYLLLSLLLISSTLGEGQTNYFGP